MADESGPIAQDKADELTPPAGSGVQPDSSAGQHPATAAGVDSPANDIELLLNKAEQALASIDGAPSDPLQALPAGIRSFEFEKFRGSVANAEVATLELMRDVQLDMTIELGRTHMHLEDVLQLRKGAVVPLDKLAGDPADIFVNGRLVARGEVLVLNDNFCIRVAELIVGEAA
ncbi:flagellar motor switch protein FliN [Bythopirellula polymerisocia]|uniref:Flagellar motor switch protein FliN n=1 Tax=Bythopirellula polymerisocia TaxID=2528003 RepID=A0A5C6CWL5_9BACT|nr:flagellar motor switch protein FliN [Bythopirellula polymerisocia]TWU27811.1 Flagellar motor switch protein FliN [Bythopirellula polymerisocia]